MALERRPVRLADSVSSFGELDEGLSVPLKVDLKVGRNWAEME